VPIVAAAPVYAPALPLGESEDGGEAEDVPESETETAEEGEAEADAEAVVWEPSVADEGECDSGVVRTAAEWEAAVAEGDRPGPAREAGEGSERPAVLPAPSAGAAPDDGPPAPGNAHGAPRREWDILNGTWMGWAWTPPEGGFGPPQRSAARAAAKRGRVNKRKPNKRKPKPSVADEGECDSGAVRTAAQRQNRDHM